MKKHWFGFHIFVLMFSSAGILFFHLLSIAAPFITIPNFPKEMLYLGVATGYGIAISLAIISIYALWRMITKVTIVNKDEKIKTNLTEDEIKTIIDSGREIQTDWSFLNKEEKDGNKP